MSQRPSFTHKQLRAFVAVAKHRSFAEACGELHLSQPALSITIRNLEEQLGGPLINRSTRSVSLTPEGEAFYPIAQRILQDWESAFDEMHNRFALRRGRLAMACMPSLAASVFPALMARFHEQYPEIDLSLEDIVMEDVLSAVHSGRVELGIAFEQEIPEDIEQQQLFSDRAVVALPPSHVLAKKKQLNWQDLSRYPFISLNARSGFRRSIDTIMQEQNAVPERIYEANQLTTAGRMAAEGLGLCLVPGFCQAQMEQMGLRCKPLVGPVFKRAVVILSRRRHGLSAPAGAMTELLMSSFDFVD
ncbi:LysR family transcriptional regulator [uncultured Pseudoteredinibacter sp.]|uniref:LysR family transcriptional regulator n=1 Tax=uncultured Pseudoteredinibacter sp. TaxID=1641701 RepID=UPI0026096CA2|nr:LysR family transcriptional regulator [uncultured Pseudoteredinibacter sp.]